MPRLLLVLVFFIVPTPLCAVASDLNVAMVVHVPYLKSWSDAQEYCRANHTDLVTIRNNRDANKVALFEGWIGLYHELNYNWKWSRGGEYARFLFWDTSSGEPHNFGWCALKYHSNQNWASDHCQHLHPFLCMDERLILVQEMKTWEEALQHCRNLTATTTEYSYDLASLPEANNLVFDRETTETTAPTEVWVGLRFLAGEWLWVSGEVVTSSFLPHCPAQQQHCGALDHNDIHWKTMNCDEKRSFLCSIKL